VSSEINIIKIGELLVKADLLNTSDVLESIQISHRLQIPIGRVLIMSGTVTEHLLQAALQAQLLIKEGLVTVDAACDALRLSVLERKTLQQAFHQLNITPGYQQDISTHLVELLLDSNIVTQAQLDDAMQTSSDADIPLSGALVLHGVLSANFFPTLLRAQEHILSGERSREEALEELKSSFLVWLRADESLKVNGEDTHLLRERIEDMHIAEMQAPRHTHEEDETNGELQQERVEPQPAKKVQSQSGEHKTSTRKGGNRLVDFFKESGVFSQSEVQQAYEKMLEQPILSGKVFQSMGLIDDDMAKFGCRCHALVQKGIFSREEAVAALRNVRAGLMTPEEALGEHAMPAQAHLGSRWKPNMVRALAGSVIGAVVAGLVLGGLRKR
jgi:hypothetical protein